MFKFMKFYVIYTLLFFSILNQSLTQVVDKNQKENPNCKDDCQFMGKYLSIFPLEGEEKKISSPLNKFDYKFLYVYTDHLAVYKASNQKDPIQGQWETPLQSEFLNNYPLNSFIMPCQGGLSVCTIDEYQQEILKDQKYELNPKVKEKIDIQNYQKTCLVLFQELNEPNDEQFIICAKNIEEIFKLKKILNKEIQLQDVKDKIGRVFMINQDLTDLIEMNLHLTKLKIYGDNKEQEENPEKASEDQKYYFSYFIGEDLPPVAAQLYDKKKSDIPWKGPSSQKPEKERCFLLESKGNDEKKGDKRNFCVFSSSDGLTPLQPKEALFVAKEWVNKINRQIKKVQDEKFFNFLKNAKNLNLDSPELSGVKHSLHSFAVELYKQCQELVKKGLKTQEQCEKEIMKEIAKKIAELCNNNEECMKALAHGIQTGAIPLTDEGFQVAWDPNNIYRGKDTNEQGKIVPSIEEITMASNTFKQCFKGKYVDKIEGNEYCCINDKKDIDIGRAVSFVPFISSFDPWMEYLGHIRDVQSSKK